MGEATRTTTVTGVATDSLARLIAESTVVFQKPVSSTEHTRDVASDMSFSL